jgi:drug/metabolite transporter (DMT)-like permease
MNEAAPQPADPAGPAPRASAVARLAQRLARLPPTARGLLWTSIAGLIFVVLNALMRALAQQVDVFQTQFLRYAAAALLMLPLLWRQGLARYRPRNAGGQFWRGAVHTAGLCLWFIALPRIALADTTAIGFTTPLFIMIGAYVFFREPMRWERWLATGIGFAGVLIVVGPKLSGGAGLHTLVMLASAPLFAASFLITKALTRTETNGTILLWQSLTITLFSLPLALPGWQWPSAWQWAGFALCGLLGSAGHYCLTQSFRVADISATQSMKFLDLIWSALLGWALFADVPTQSTLIGGAVICAATIWVARRESRGAIAAATEPAPR